MAYSQYYQAYNKKKNNGASSITPADILAEVNSKIEANTPKPAVVSTPVAAQPQPQKTGFLSKFQVAPPASKLTLGNTDDTIKGNGFWEKIRTVEDNIGNNLNANPLYKGVANSLPVKVLNRTAYSAANTMTGGGAVGSNPDLGTVGNTVTDFLGFGLGMGMRNPGLNGGSINSALSPVGKIAEKGVVKGLNKLGPVLPTTVNKVANYALPTAARGAAEFGLYGGANNAVQGKDILQGAEEGALSGALFNVGAKALGSAVKGISKNALKTNITVNGKAESPSNKLETPLGLISNKISKPYSQKYTVVNTELRKAQQAYDDAIQTIQNRFMTNKLLPEEIPLIKSELGIDIEKLANDLATAKTNVSKIGDNANMAIVAGVKDIPTNPLVKANIVKADKATPKTLNTNIGTHSLEVKLDNTQSSGKESTAGKNRQFIDNSVQNSNIAPEEMKSTIESQPYEHISNKETWEKAQNKVDSDLQGSLNEFISKSEVKSADDTALGEALISKAIQDNRIDDANSLAVNLAEKLTKAGQTVQAAAIFKRLSPEGMLQYAVNTIKKANDKLPPNKQITLSDEVASKIVKDMQDIAKMPEGEAKTEATQLVLKHIADQIPAGILKKIDTFQTMAQLLNPKTSIRNILGNAGNLVNENLSNVVGTPLDKAVSLFTGKRTVVMPSIGTQLSGAKEGFQNGLRQTKLGIEGDNTQFDLPKGQIYKDKGIGKVLNTGQKVLDYLLRVPDEAAKEAIRKESLRTQMKVAGVEVPTEEMKIIAENDAKYGTFQDDTKLAQAFSSIKKGLNLNKDFGLGSLLLKYPKTPANIIMRAIDYSPAGFFKSVYRLAEPLMTGKEFNQRDFVKTTSRALVGTGNLIGTGYILSELGIITGKSSDDTDTANMQKQIGLGNYKLNLSALNRFVTSGFDTSAAKIQKGDHLINYDWLQPSSIGLAIGANASQNKESDSVLSTAVDALNSGIDTLAQQPLMSGLTNFFGQGKYDLGKAITSTIKGVPASITPTVLKQVAQIMDNTTRNTYDESWVKQGENMVKAKLPGLSSTLQPKLDSLGNEQKAYENNNLFNVFLNPAFSSIYNPKPEAQLPLDIYNNTGNVTSMPRQTPNYIMNGGQRINLTPQENADFQRNVGQQTAVALNKLSNLPADDNTAKVIANLITKIQQNERDKILNNRGISTTPDKKTNSQKLQEKKNTKTEKDILNRLGIK